MFSQNQTGGMFGQNQNTPSIFGQQQPQQQQTQNVGFGQQQQQQQPGGVFGVQPQSVTSANPFGQATSSVITTNSITSPAVSSKPVVSDPFAQKSSTGSGGGMFGQKVAEQLDNSIYTPIESLTPQEMEAFKSPSFVLGSIPERPPPREFCVC